MQRLICLDGVRGALAAYVMLSHMAPFGVVPGWLASLLSHGGAGVDMFFILSGLVIVRSLQSLGWQARPFLIARAFRIFPVYLAMFALALAVQPLPAAFDAMPWVAADSPARFIWSEGWPHAWIVEIAAHLTMTHGLFPNAVLPDAWVSFLGAAWSLSTEWQFYLLVLACGLVLTRGRAQPFGEEPRPDRLASLRTPRLPHLVIVFMLLGVAGVGWQLLAPAPWQLFSRAFLPNKAQYFALGIASAMLVEGGSWRAYAAALAGTLLVCGWLGELDKLLPPLVWTVCLVAQLHPELPGMAVLRRVLQARPMLWLGSISYCLYLANEPLQKVFGLGLAWLAHGDGRLFTLFWVPLAILVPLLVADWLHRHIEAPAQRRGRTFATRIVQPREERPVWIAINPASRSTTPRP
ncbi:MAG: acyltransferase [Acetobacteraceae bacterium]|nr:acyltransferase [Acetobacteraceae bacterium]